MLLSSEIRIIQKLGWRDISSELIFLFLVSRVVKILETVPINMSTLSMKKISLIPEL